MSELTEIIRELTEAGKTPERAILNSIAESGKKAIGCFPIYTPEEIVYAAGLLPVGMWGGQKKGNLSDKYIQGFCCSLMKANTEQALSGKYDLLSGVIITAFCDTLKCVLENWKVASPQLNIIPIVYPQNRKLASGRKFMREELLRVKKELEEISGNVIQEENLTASVDLYDEYRSAMQEFVEVASSQPSIIDAGARHLIIKSAFYMDKKIYIKRIRTLIDLLKEMEPENHKKKKVVLTGLLAEPVGLLDILTENNLMVVADDLAQESRQFRTIAPREGDGLDRMVERIVRQDGCAFLYDQQKTRGKMLLDLVEKTNADGIIVCQLKFCDPEEFDYPILRKEFHQAGVPHLYIEIEQTIDSFEQLRTRIQSFSEMI